MWLRLTLEGHVMKLCVGKYDVALIHELYLTIYSEEKAKREASK
jgi:hypothetical protein